MILSDDVNEYLSIVLMITFMVHLPFGFAGSAFKKYSRPWARCLYIPIILTIILRRMTDIDYAYVPYFIVVALSAQVLGRRLGKVRKLTWRKEKVDI